jgi:hypothetical protein
VEGLDQLKMGALAFAKVDLGACQVCFATTALQRRAPHLYMGEAEAGRNNTHQHTHGYPQRCFFLKVYILLFIDLWIELARKVLYHSTT